MGQPNCPVAPAAEPSAKRTYNPENVFRSNTNSPPGD